MPGLTKAVSSLFIAGLICFCFAGHASAGSKKADEEQESGEVPLYYLQLQDFKVYLEKEALRPEILEYTVEPGDCLYSIAVQFGTNVDTLVYLNKITTPGLIHPGDCLEILTVVGCVHDVKDGDTITAIAASYGVEEKVIIQANELRTSPTLHRGERIIVPGGALSRGRSRPAFRWPLRGALTSGYGWRNGKFHYGIDIGSAYGTAFQAAAGGRVTFAGYRGSYGIMIEVDHGAGYRTRYGHARKAVVSPGQQVKPGQILGYVGLTGNTTGPHLHFEIRVGDKKVNPLRFID